MDLASLQKVYKKNCAGFREFAKTANLPFPTFSEDSCQLLSEYGCGHYGCVYPTSNPDTVFKLTTDVSEAHFIACLKELEAEQNFDFDGLVKYNALVGVPNAKIRGKNVFALWRQEAYFVGSWGSNVDQVAPGNSKQYVRQTAREVSHLIMQVKGASHAVRSILNKLLKKNVPLQNNDDYWSAVGTAMKLVLDGNYQEGIIDNDGNPRIVSPFDQGDLFRDLFGNIGNKPDKVGAAVAFYLTLVFYQSDMLESTYMGDAVGRAFNELTRKGLLLADVHLGNIGLVMKPESERTNGFTDEDAALLQELKAEAPISDEGKWNKFHELHNKKTKLLHPTTTPAQSSQTRVTWLF